MPLGIILGANGKPRPAWHCNICETDFGPHQRMAFRQHVIQCAKQHEPELEQLVEDMTKGTFSSAVQEDVQEEYEYERKKAQAEGEISK